MDQLLASLKVDLGIMGDAYNDRLTQLLDYSRQVIQGKGVILNITDSEDSQLIVMYAQWLWRRRDSGEGMPKMLRYALNNRLIGRVDGGKPHGQCN